MDSIAQNPLLDDGRPHRLPDFGAIRPDHVGPALEARLAAYRAGIEKALHAAGEHPWSLVEAETEWADAVGRVWSPVSHLNSVADNEALRQAYNDGLERLTEHDNWRQQHPGIYRLYRALKNSPDFDRLAPVQRRIVELELRDFHLAGVDLPPEDQEIYRDLVLRLSRLGAKFSENLLDATRAWTRHFDDPTALAGLPEAELKLLQGIARSRGSEGWMVDLSAPSFQAVMTHADDRELRRDVYTAYVTRASDQGPMAGQWDNAPLISEMLDLRHRLARVLGFDNYVDYALSTRMAESPKSVLGFLGELAGRAKASARQQFAELEAFAAAGGAAVPLEAWDVAYWSERYRQSELQLSDEQLKPYFPLDRMLEALLHTARHLFGVRLVEDREIAAWHEDVRYFWLEDRGGKRFAGLYMDLFARPDKRGGAWMDVCLSKRRAAAGPQLPVAFLTCNFAPPVDDQPSLLTHDDLQTLFHEFGHCLHHLLTDIEWPQVNGISNVEWDAVELPSQLLENWCWEDDLLAGYARHFRSGEPLPVELKERLLRSRQFQKALFLVRQLEYALCDLRLHLEYDPDDPADPQELLRDIRKQVAVVPVPDWNRFLNSFAHIFGGGYAAGYYSYLWAEQLAADAWGRFREEGILAPETGDALRREILAVGGSRPAIESFEAFRGRPPEPGPLLEVYGLL
ncbi:MAG: M3 family metallopeptidase [Xanthomonadales bacterium]|nr:M3 family metallopeptidase [Xanthomonadales bacterium]